MLRFQFIEDFHKHYLTCLRTGTFHWGEQKVKSWVVRGPVGAQGPGGRSREEQSMEPISQSPLMPAWRYTQCHVFLQLFPHMMINVRLGWISPCRKEQTSCRFLNGTVSLAKHSFLHSKLRVICPDLVPSLPPV